MKICVVTGSRADAGLLAWPIKLLKADPFFEVDELSVQFQRFEDAHYNAETRFQLKRPDAILVLGDRFEILAVVIAAHRQRVPIIHLCGGDVSEGSYDDAMRDCISRMAAVHFTTSESATARLVQMGCRNVYNVGSTSIDYIMHGDWKKPRPFPESYVVVAYYPETIDDTVNLDAVREAVGGRAAAWISQNPDRGAERIPKGVSYSHDKFLNLLLYCEEFIGNSSAMLYEAPFLSVKCRIIGKRQRGRVIPEGDGKASERIVNTLKYVTL